MEKLLNLDLAAHQDLFEEVELFLACRELKSQDLLSKSDPKLKIYLIQEGKETFLGETEVLKDNLNPNFEKTFSFHYQFEIPQKLKFCLYDYNSVGKDDYISEVSDQVGKLAATGICKLPFVDKKGKNIGHVLINLEKTQAKKEFIEWKWTASHLKDVSGVFGKNSPALRFFKYCKDIEDWIPIYETNVNVKSGDMATWNKFSISVDRLCNGDWHQPFVLQCVSKNKGKNILIGEAKTTLNEIKNDQKMKFDLKQASSENSVGQIYVIEPHFGKEFPTFFDYVKDGEKLSLMVAIDFTESNMDPIDPNSLHYLPQNGESWNPYQTCLHTILPILLPYTIPLSSIQVLGFGAKKIGGSAVNHCLEIANVKNIQELMVSYKETAENLIFSGPTRFSGVVGRGLVEAEKRVKEDEKQYTVMLILTDGDIHDLAETIDLLAQSSNAPLSIIIIGIGNENFEKMITLDGDDQWAKYGEDVRDLVQFVAFNDFQGNAPRLASELLAELPAQLVEYKMRTGQKPNYSRILRFESERKL